MRRSPVLMIVLVSTAIGILFFSCAALDSVISDSVQKPNVSFQSAELVGLSFSDADMLFVLEIENPNPFGVHMAGFDYDFKIDDATFVSGKKDDRLDVDAGGTSTVELPLNLIYRDLFNSFSSLVDRDESSYEITLGFLFDLPVLGTIRIPVSREGVIPVLRIPNIRYGELRMTDLSFTEAELELTLHLVNPNALKLKLSSLSYDLETNRNPWVQGVLERSVEVGEHEEGVIRLPFSLNLIDIGLGTYNMLNNRDEVEYRVSGDYGFSTSLPLIGEVSSEYDFTGSTMILNR